MHRQVILILILILIQVNIDSKNIEYNIHGIIQPTINNLPNQISDCSEEHFKSIYDLQLYLYKEGFKWKYLDENYYQSKVNTVELFTYKINGDQDKDTEFLIRQKVKPILFEDEEYDSEFEGNNLFYIDRVNDCYLIADSIIQNDMSCYSFKNDLHISDIDRNGINEIHLEERCVTTSPGVHSKSNLLTIVDKKINLQKGVEGKLKIFNSIKNEYYSIYPVWQWQIGEGRYDDHFFEVQYLKYVDNKFELIWRDTTSRKFNGFDIDKLEILTNVLNNEGMTIDAKPEKISVKLESCNLIFNDHVGNEWYFGSYVNGNLINYKERIELILPSDKKIKLQSILMEENEKYNDHGRSESEINLNNKPAVIKQLVRITETNGRYAGNSAEFEFVYSINYIE